MEYIIVQAGGKGTRLGYLTANKPKALVPVENLPMLFHLFKKYPDKKFIIIADYKKEVLREYLAAFADVKYLIVDADGTGTCAGLKQAATLIPDNKSFMLIWSDLILPDDFLLPEIKENYIGISQTFQCRWSYKDNVFSEEKSYEHGVAGFFLFKNKSYIKDIPESGELVRWMKENNITFTEIGLAGTKEFGILEEYNKLEKEKCRPFNKMTFDGDMIIKEGIDEQGRKLAERECRWYDKAKEKNSEVLPKIYGTNPLKMEFIKGKNIYEYNIPYDEKKIILEKLISSLKQLHNAEKVTADLFSIKEAYFNKTMKRIETVRDMIPFADKHEIVINGKKCRNVYYYKRELEKKLESIKCGEFCFIHGDCTFSNLMLRDNGMPVLIDPRGYFGFTELYGDELYDWAKLYYSIVGNYDMFNLKKFRLSINENDVTLKIDSNHWEDTEDDFFSMTGANVNDIKLMHAVIWLSLTTYAWQDYDSVCGAFYNGLYYLEDVL